MPRGFAEIVAGDQRRQNDGVCQCQCELGKDEDGQALLDLLPRRQTDEGRHRPGGFGHRQRLQIESPTADDGADKGNGGRREPRDPQKHSQQDKERHAEHGGRAHEIEPHESQGDAEAELQASQDRLRHQPAKLVDPARAAKDQQDRANHHAACGEARWRHFRGQQDSRHGLHWLDRDRQSIPDSGCDVGDRKSQHDRHRRDADDGNRSEHQREQRSQITERAARLPQIEPEPFTLDEAVSFRVVRQA